MCVCERCNFNYDLVVWNKILHTRFWGGPAKSDGCYYPTSSHWSTFTLTIALSCMYREGEEVLKVICNLRCVVLWQSHRPSCYMRVTSTWEPLKWRHLHRKAHIRVWVGERIFWSIFGSDDCGWIFVIKDSFLRWLGLGFWPYAWVYDMGPIHNVPPPPIILRDFTCLHRKTRGSRSKLCFFTIKDSPHIWRLLFAAVMPRYWYHSSVSRLLYSNMQLAIRIL